jgi:hypothetical protein
MNLKALLFCKTFTLLLNDFAYILMVNIFTFLYKYEILDFSKSLYMEVQ